MENKIAFITGATSGIGAAFSRRYGSMGYDLLITGRRADKINQLAEEIREKNGVRVEVILTELSTDRDIELLIERIEGRNIHVLVNNAGFGYTALFHEGDMKVFEAMIHVHVLAAVRLVHAVLPGMVKRGEGAIINVSSEGAFLSIPKNSIYSGTKAFLKSFTEALNLDLIHTGVKVQALCPGLTRSDFHEKIGIGKERQVNRGLVKWMLPEEVVDASLKDLEKGRVVCVPGIREKTLIKVANWMPRSLYNRLACNFGRNT